MTLRENLASPLGACVLFLVSSGRFWQVQSMFMIFLLELENGVEVVQRLELGADSMVVIRETEYGAVKNG